MRRRDKVRYAIRVEAVYELQQGDRARVLSEALNVSEHGCALLTGDRMEAAGTSLTVQLIWAEHQLKLEGTVVWSRAPKLGPSGTLSEAGTMGVRFRLDGPAPRALQALLEAAKGKGRSHG